MATKNKIIKMSTSYSRKVVAESLRKSNQKVRAQRSDAGKKRKP